MTFNGDLSPLDAVVSENSAVPITPLGPGRRGPTPALSDAHLLAAIRSDLAGIVRLRRRVAE